MLKQSQCLSFNLPKPPFLNKVRSTHASVQFPIPRRWLVGLLILLLVALLAWWLWPAATPAHKAASAGRGGKGMGMGMGRPGFGGSTDPVPVRVEPVRVGDFPLYYKALGTVTATNTVNVRSRVAGELVKILFKEGQQVKAGDLLAEIDPRPYRIALQQAEGTLAQNQAQLKTPRSTWRVTRACMPRTASPSRPSIPQKPRLRSSRGWSRPTRHRSTMPA